MGKEELKQAVLTAKELLFSDPETKAKFKDLTTISGFKDLLNTFPLLWWLLKRVAYAVELVQVEYQLCTESERIEVAADLLDDLITFKGWLSIFEPFDDVLWKLLISAAVQALNDLLGHDWIKVALEKESDTKKFLATL